MDLDSDHGGRGTPAEQPTFSEECLEALEKAHCNVQFGVRNTEWKVF